MLNEYIIVTTFCDKEEIANKIVDTLLEKDQQLDVNFLRFIPNIGGIMNQKNAMNINQNLEQKKVYLAKQKLK